MLNDFNCSVQLDWLLSDNLHRVLLVHIYRHLPVNNFNISDRHDSFDNSVSEGRYFFLNDYFNRDPSLHLNSLHDFPLDVGHHCFFDLCHLDLLLDNYLWNFLPQDLLNFVGYVNRHRPFDLDDFDNFDLPLNNLLNDLGHFHNSFDNPRNHNNLFYNFLDLNHSRNLYYLLNEPIHGDSNLFDNFLLLNDWHRNLFDDLHRHLLTIRHKLFHFNCHDLWFRLDVGNFELDVNRFFNGYVKWHRLIDLNVLCNDDLPINRLFLYLLNLQYHLFGVSFHCFDRFSRNFLDDVPGEDGWCLDGYLNQLLLYRCRLHNLLNRLHDIHWDLNSVGDGYGNLLLHLHHFRNLDEVVDDLLNLDVLGDFNWNLLNHLNFLDFRNLLQAVYDFLFVSVNLNNLLDDLFDGH